jgi:hypothetical protein
MFYYFIVNFNAHHRSPLLYSILLGRDHVGLGEFDSFRYYVLECLLSCVKWIIYFFDIKKCTPYLTTGLFLPHSFALSQSFRIFFSPSLSRVFSLMADIQDLPPAISQQGDLCHVAVAVTRIALCSHLFVQFSS